MTVYVDNMKRRARVGRINGVWSHLMADTHEELMSMAAELSLRPEWIQHEGTHREHFDLTEPKRIQAIGFGAVRIDYPRGTGQILAAKKAAASRYVCPTTCQYADDVGISGAASPPCPGGYCDHYAPTAPPATCNPAIAAREHVSTSEESTE